MNNDQSRIEELKKRLYSVSGAPSDQGRSGLRHHANLVDTHWAGEDGELEPPEIPMRKYYEDTANKKSILPKILIIFILGLIAALAFAWYTFSTGGNYITGANIDIQAVGPVATPAGEVLTLDIDVVNNNPEELRTVDLLVEYPEGTRKADDRVTTVLSERIPIGTIEKGGVVRRRIQVLLFGEENIKKEIKITVEYKVPGSVVIFNKEKIYPIYIGSAPVSIEIQNTKEVTPNQSTVFKAIITSNSQNVIRNLVLRADYPSGFKYESAIPSPSHSSNVWNLGDMQPADKREISITGQILGDANIERYFTFSAGTESPLDNSQIAVKIIETQEKVSIKRPFVSAEITLNKVGEATYVTPAGQPVRGEIVWQNNLDVPLYDLVLELKVKGASADKKTVVAERGYYNSQANTIIWEANDIDDLKEIQPGGSGSFQFAFASLPPTVENNRNLRRQQIDLALTVRAKRLSEANVPEVLKAESSRIVKVESGLLLNSHLVRYIGPFENTGPIPPVVEQASTYTVLNSVTNSFNNVTGAVYKTTLPSYVTWLGKVYPESAAANIKYNPDTRELVWNLGDLAPGVGFNSSAREFSYQVSITPSYSQIGVAPVVINNQTISGNDTFTNSVIEYRAGGLTTDIQTDPKFEFGMEKVVE